jgi:predicted unusual protein kinase regulating ubiquinone biosynthesis (AarF/ABC1/UbiB family)
MCLSSCHQGYNQLHCSLQVLSRTAEAYGTMILSSGLFQADGHPGNILIMSNGVVGLIDYGQSKQLSDEERLKFARLVLAIARYA